MPVWSWHKINASLYDRPLYKALVCFLDKALLIALVYFPIVVLIIWTKGDISLIFWWVIEWRVIGVLNIEYMSTILPFFIAFLANLSVKSFPEIFACFRHHWKRMADIGILLIRWMHLIMFQIRYWPYCWSGDYKERMALSESEKTTISRLYFFITTK